MRQRNLYDEGENLAHLFDRLFWSNNAVLQAGLRKRDTGVELISSANLAELSREFGVSGEASSKIPDVMVERPEVLGGPVFLDYKAMKRPRYREGDNQWNVGQVEADAWYGYLEWHRGASAVGGGVALLVYCSFHSRPLVCEWVNEGLLYGSRRPVTRRTDGSGTDYVNLRLLSMRRFSDFASQELGLPVGVAGRLSSHMMSATFRDQRLQTVHHPKSPYHHGSGRQESGTAPTAFNWEMRADL